LRRGDYLFGEAANRRMPLYQQEMSWSMIKERIALKYCGGCNPTFDRVEYVRKIQSAAEDRIEWTTLDDGHWDKVLLIHGCDTACLEKNFDFSKIISIRNDAQDPGEIVQRLLSEEKNED